MQHQAAYTLKIRKEIIVVIAAVLTHTEIGFHTSGTSGQIFGLHLLLHLIERSTTTWAESFANNGRLPSPPSEEVGVRKLQVIGGVNGRWKSALPRNCSTSSPATLIKSDENGPEDCGGWGFHQE
ncbi:hypothetical protein OUZ56_014472 [Daphnia magna]|uniref:Uncharacterized protein n=1 Tax=Daphnia magna TaxID=35525 RepID=A0ABR0AJV1_9CRUS|nr:hypothetical protein OUZ56_014472 [Daphnia magna]